MRRPQMAGMLVKRTIGATVLLLALAACGSDDDDPSAQDSSTDTTSAVDDAVSEAVGDDSGEVEDIECEDAISIADVARITGLPITTCFGAGQFRTDDSVGLNIWVQRHPSAESAREEAQIEGGTGAHFSGSGWEAVESLGGADAVAGDLSIRIIRSGFGDGSLDGRSAEELRTLFTAIFDAVVGKVG